VTHVPPLPGSLASRALCFGRRDDHCADLDARRHHHPADRGVDWQYNLNSAAPAAGRTRRFHLEPAGCPPWAFPPKTWPRSASAGRGLFAYQERIHQSWSGAGVSFICSRRRQSKQIQTETLPPFQRPTRRLDRLTWPLCCGASKAAKLPNFQRNRCR